ncbi:hypothetical protein D3C78_1638740 [compost metagenome]
MKKCLETIGESLMKIEWVEHISDERVILHNDDGSTTIIQGTPSVDNCKIFIKTLILEKRRLASIK